MVHVIFYLYNSITPTILPLFALTVLFTTATIAKVLPYLAQHTFHANPNPNPNQPKKTQTQTHETLIKKINFPHVIIAFLVSMIQFVQHSIFWLFYHQHVQHIKW